MFCQSCGGKLKEGAQFCASCGSSVAGGTSNSYTPPPVQNNTQFSQSNQMSSVQTEDKQSAGFNFLSVLFPIIGFILFFTWKKSTPIKAKGVLSSAFIGLAIEVFFVIFMVL